MDTNTNIKKQEEEKKKKKRRLLFWLFLLFLLLVLCFSLGEMILSHNKENLYEGQTVTYDNHITRPNLKASEAAFPGFGNFTVTHPGKEVAIALANPKYNSVDLKFTVTLTQSPSSKLVQTKLIAPGKALLKMKTPNHGKKGSYPLDIKIQAFKRSSRHEAMNSVDQKIVMTIN